jgi:hypothetical protein
MVTGPSLSVSLVSLPGAGSQDHGAAGPAPDPVTR